MRVGDKVILRKFETNPILQWVDGLSKYVDKVVEVLSVEDSDGTFSIRDEDFLLNEWWWPQSACESVKKERYFMFSYMANEGFGNCFIKKSGGQFPKESEIKDVVKNQHDININVTNIFEFKSEQDFLDFTNE